MRELTLNIELPADASLAEGQPLLVELRDTSLQDVAATVLDRVRAVLPRDWRNGIQVRVPVGDLPDGTTVWAHLDADRDGRVSSGDFITMQSYPVSATGPREISVQLRKV